MKQLLHNIIITNKYAVVARQSLVKYQKVSKYHDHDCQQNFLLHSMSLVTDRYVKNSHILAGQCFIFPEKIHRLNLKVTATGLEPRTI